MLAEDRFRKLILSEVKIVIFMLKLTMSMAAKRGECLTTD